MKLAEWLDTKGITRTAFGERVGLKPSSMTDLCQGKNWVSPRVARAIERETNGEVTIADLLADYRGNQEAAA